MQSLPFLILRINAQQHTAEDIFSSAVYYVLKNV